MRRFSALALALALFTAGTALAEATKIRILTYNLGLLTVARKDYVPDVAKRTAAAPKIVAALAKAKKVDIVVLQEVWKEAAAKAISKALEAEGYVTFRAGPEEDFVKLGTGLLLAFRKDTVQVVEKSTKSIPFKSKGFADSFTHKGFATATLSVVGKKDLVFEAITAHLQVLEVDPKSGKITGKDDGIAHAAQLAQLEEVVTARSDDGKKPVVFAGDLNVGPGLGEENFEIIAKDLKLTNAFLELHPFEKQKKDALLVSWDRPNPLVKNGKYPNDPSALIDHVLFRNGKNGTFTPKSCSIEAKENAEGLTTPLSDHYAVLCELELTP